MSEQSAVETTIELDPTRPAFGPDERIGDLGRTHFIGIGGAGMSVLAEMLHEQGVVVDGSDREPSPKTDRLQSLGVAVQFGQRAQNVAGAATVVYSSAIKPDNPEIVAAHAAGARIVHRSDILALLMAAKRAVTVAGAHGKTHHQLAARPHPGQRGNRGARRPQLRHRRLHPVAGRHEP